MISGREEGKKGGRISLDSRNWRWLHVLLCVSLHNKEKTIESEELEMLEFENEEEQDHHAVKKELDVAYTHTCSL
jgi:hypothetical protein